MNDVWGMNWWKAPVLQGPENDYGDYDYLIEELPHDYAKWEFTPYTCRCHSCGKERHLNFRSEHFFYCYDGWDSMDYTECWVCDIKDRIYSIKRKFKFRIKAFKLARELYKTNTTRTFKHYYELAKKIVR